jgi:hypothetical protein
MIPKRAPSPVMPVAPRIYGYTSQPRQARKHLVSTGKFDKLDLLVRELVQNSLDARLPGKEVAIHIVVQDNNLPRVDALQEFLGQSDAFQLKPTDHLIGRVAGKRLLVRDTGTTGLTGAPEILREMSGLDEAVGDNLLKFMHLDLTHPTVESRGGSHGKGKLAAYDAGFGLVVVYSRVKQDQRFIDRLSARWLHLSNDCPILDKVQSRTQLWWLKQGKVWDQPVIGSDSSDMRHWLKRLGFPEFEAGETGTCVLVPFLDPDVLGVAAESTGFERDFERAVRRWYGARIANGASDARSGLGARSRQSDERPADTGRLSVFVNDEPVSAGELENLEREMYLACLDKNERNVRIKGIGVPVEVRFHKATIKRTELSFTFAWARVPQQLSMHVNPSFLPPRGYGLGPSQSVYVTSMRALGMAMSWSPGLIENSGDTDIILGIVMPGDASSELILKESETPEHSSWGPENSQNGIRTAVREFVRESIGLQVPSAPRAQTSDVSASRYFGMALGLFGTEGTRRIATSKSGRRVGEPRKRKDPVRVESGLDFDHDGVKVFYCVHDRKRKLVDLELAVWSGKEWVTERDWRNKFDKLDFPVRFGLSRLTVVSGPTNARVSELLSFCRGLPPLAVRIQEVAS